MILTLLRRCVAIAVRWRDCQEQQDGAVDDALPESTSTPKRWQDGHELQSRALARSDPAMSRFNMEFNIDLDVDLDLDSDQPIQARSSVDDSLVLEVEDRPGEWIRADRGSYLAWGDDRQ